MNFSKSKQWEINPNEKYIYYDMACQNNDDEGTENINQLVFQDTRDTPIINKMSDYKLSIVRFQMGTWQLPIGYFETRYNSSDPDEGVYSITLEYVNGGLVVSGNHERVFFIPQDKSKTKPQPPNTFPYGVSGFNEYYYIYNYTNFIDMINQTFDLAFTKLQGLVGAPLATAKPPVMVWNPDLTASLYTELDYFNITNVEHVKIYFNRSLYSLFNSFPSYKFTPEVGTGKFYQILTNPYSGVNTATIPEYGSSVLIVTKQEFSTSELWSPIDSIVFTSNMGIVSSILSNPTIYQNGVQLALSGTYNNSQRVISDFQTSEFNYRSSLTYIPSAQYRYYSFLNNDVPLTQVTIFVWVKDKLGILRPFILSPNSHASMKILFERIN